jgi:hypothetical protein
VLDAARGSFLNDAYFGMRVSIESELYEELESQKTPETEKPEVRNLGLFRNLLLVGASGLEPLTPTV